MYTNAQPRFGLHEDGRLIDYAKGTTVEPTGTLKDDAGTWDLAKVKELIQQHKPVEAALNAGANGSTAPAKTKFTDKVKQAWHDFEAHFKDDVFEDEDKVAQAGKEFHTMVGKHISSLEAAVHEDPKPDNYAAGTGSLSPTEVNTTADPSVTEFPKPGTPATHLHAPLQPTGAVVGTGLDAATPGAASTAVQQNAEFKDSGKSVAMVDQHDVQKTNALGADTNAVKEASKGS